MPQETEVVTRACSRSISNLNCSDVVNVVRGLCSFMELRQMKWCCSTCFWLPCTKNVFSSHPVVGVKGIRDPPSNPKQHAVPAVFKLMSLVNADNLKLTAVLNFTKFSLRRRGIGSWLIWVCKARYRLLCCAHTEAHICAHGDGSLEL